MYFKKKKITRIEIGHHRRDDIRHHYFPNDYDDHQNLDNFDHFHNHHFVEVLCYNLLDRQHNLAVHQLHSNYLRRHKPVHLLKVHQILSDQNKHYTIHRWPKKF